MTNALANLNVRLGFIFDDKSLKRVERSLQRSGERLSSVGQSLSVSISAPLALLGAGAIKAAGDFESLTLAMQATFKNAGRSVGEANAEVEALRKAALAPGLDFPQAVAASIRLQSVGTDAETARGTIVELANAIASTGGTAQNLESVTVQFAQMISKGKVLAGDLRIVQENLPIISDLMLKAFGTSNSENIQKLGITGKEFVTKITAEMTKLSRVEGGISNAIVNAGSAIRQFLVGIGNEINKAFNIADISDAFSKKLESIGAAFAGLSDETKKNIIVAAGLAASLGPLVLAIGTVKTVAGTLIGTYASLVGGLKSVRNAVIAATGPLRVLSATAQSFVLIGIVVAIGALVVAYGNWSNEISFAEKKQRALNDIQKEAEASIYGEKIAAEKLIGVINSETASRAAKLQAISDLKAISPEYFGQLTEENGLVIGLKDAYDGYIANIIRAAKEKKRTDKLTALSDERDKLVEENKRLSKAAGRADALAASDLRGPANFGSSSTQFNAGASQEALKANEALIKSNDALTNSLIEEGQAEFESANAKVVNKDAGKKLGSGVADVTDQTKKIKEAEAEEVRQLELYAKFVREVEQAWLDEAAAAKDGIKQIKDANPDFAKLGPRGQTAPAVPSTISDAQIKAFDEERAAHDKLMEDFKASRKSAALSIAESTLSIFSSLADAQTSKELADLESTGAARLAAAKGNADLEASIRADLDNQRAQIEKKAAKRQKRLALIEAIINTAVGVTKAISSAPPPFNIPAIIAAAAAGASQVAIIASQAFAKGTKDAPGGISLVGEKGPELVNLPRHSQVYTAKQTSAMLNGGLGGSEVSISGEFRVKGTDLVLILERQQSKNQRTR